MFSERGGIWEVSPVGTASRLPRAQSVLPTGQPVNKQTNEPTEITSHGWLSGAHFNLNFTLLASTKLLNTFI